MKKPSFDILHKEPLLIVISGISGVGKDSVIRCLKERDLGIHFVITATSRAPRADEVDGRDYFFYSREEFEERIKRGEFLEYALVYEDYKGIPCAQIDDALMSAKDVVVKVDVQGAATLRRLYPNALLLFVAPRNFDEWYQRLTKRNTESEENLKVRLDTARKELEQIGMFDYIVINATGKLESAVEDIITIIRAEHLAVKHRKML